MDATSLLSGGGLAFGYLAVKDFIWPAILKQRTRSNGNGNARPVQARVGDLAPSDLELMMRDTVEQELTKAMQHQNELLTDIRTGIATLITTWRSRT